MADDDDVFVPQEKSVKKLEKLGKDTFPPSKLWGNHVGESSFDSATKTINTVHVRILGIYPVITQKYTIYKAYTNGVNIPSHLMYIHEL